MGAGRGWDALRLLVSVKSNTARGVVRSYWRSFCEPFGRELSPLCLMYGVGEEMPVEEEESEGEMGSDNGEISSKQKYRALKQRLKYLAYVGHVTRFPSIRLFTSFICVSKGTRML